MKYSEAFENLFNMSLDTNIVAHTKQEGIAFFLGRIAMAEKRMGSIAGVEKYLNYKEGALQHLVEITDIEWTMVREVMEEHISSSSASTWWKAMRMEWVYALDTLRAFEP